ncbi:MAG: TetR/AcrR family transcriptional regulator [Bradyrhizobium sp.]|nr:TetR/AcrR family transcriptional regulator [Pseudomonadota bacterium]MDE2068845.1 TetR/AcrR family transcriptional regulator [Bradyrhizobium sp.]MDE2244256.1 TetR/AcrR family transcriptional regulator [Bradyrhizobium sp.]MDE2468426.1 TetR/AcrR family transcriptional regulator [Bradyrhizobium sp.]
MTKTPAKPANAIRAKPTKPRREKAAQGRMSAQPEPASEPPSGRVARAAERREAIIVAAMEEFVGRGYAATRLDDVARRAGVAKGTIYLHFKDKEALFEELIRTAIVPLVNRIVPPANPGGSVRDMIELFARAFIQEVATTQRADIIRLIVAEGPRFPAIADFYYREVVSRGLAKLRALIELGIARGELRQPELAHFPQIVVAPAIVAVIWKSLFENHSPLDALEMFRVHLDLIFGERRTT